MTAISAPFHGLSTTLYTSSSAVSLSSPGTAIGEVASIGTLDLSANIIEFNNYGTAYKRKLVGQKDSGTLEIVLNWVADASTQADHASLKARYDDGAKAHFAIIWTDPAGSVAGATFEGYVASFALETPVEDVVTATVQVAIDGAVTFDVDGTL